MLVIPATWVWCEFTWELNSIVWLTYYIECVLLNYFIVLSFVSF